jgi:molybdate transport system substrate-binding protein
MSTRRAILGRIAALVAFAGLATAPLAPALAQEGGPVVFAAASLKNVLDAINAAWKAESGKSATISYAGSSALAKQIESGAPADIFISADLDWMDYLAGKKLIRDDTRADLLGNTIVLVAPKQSTATITIEKGFGLADLLGDGRLSMASVDSVPAGKYGKAALEWLGVWDSVKDRLAQAENVRAALLLVSRGETPLGIVYATDAAADPGVKVIATFPDESHGPIVYPLAVTASSQSAEATAFADYLQTDAARALFERQGFTVLAVP